MAEKKYGAIVLAAGYSRHVNRYREMMEVDDISFTERIVTSFRRAGVETIVVVTGYNAEQEEEALKNSGAHFLRNENYENTSMIDSVRMGLSWIRGKADRIFITPETVPFFHEDTVRFEMKCSEPLVMPILGHKMGHPILIDDSLIPAIMEYSGNNGLRGALRSIPGLVPYYMHVDDEGVTIKENSNDVLQHAIDTQNSKLLRVKTTVSLVSGREFFNPAMLALLKEIRECGSVRQACGKAGVSYNSAWRMIARAEKQLGYRIVKRQTGGKSGGGTVITPRGAKLIRIYDTLQKDISRYAEMKFQQLMEEAVQKSEIQGIKYS